MKVKLALASLLFTTSAYAEFWDGNKLLSRMNGSLDDQFMALGYVMGIADAGHGVNHCPPPNVNAGQVQDIAKNYLNTNPAVRHLSADALVMRSLKRVFPCADAKPSGGRNL